MSEYIEGGRELSNMPKQGTLEYPLITIITSTFNAAQDLHWTIDSIRSQNYPNIQWIIADGASTDGTVNIIKENEDIIDFWFSEVDDGIYDAWNKALPYANGEWIQFLGAGDEIINDVYNKVFKDISIDNIDLLYGNINIISPKNRIYIEKFGCDWGILKNKWQGFRPALPVHPEVFHNSKIFKNGYRFDTNYKIAADSKLLLEVIHQGNIKYLDRDIVDMSFGGVSTTPEKARIINRELISICNELGINIGRIRFLYYSFKEFIKFLIFKLFGDRLYRTILDLCRVILGKSKKWTVDE
ncbi:MAG: hypothetical protein CENE_00514 [Candidatus Celerinatantimonas neptuna]|nr:MAG: hypothetical protein CENE_00514 [Candidatus Celerinatantimonas neptuna]